MITQANLQSLFDCRDGKLVRKTSTSRLAKKGMIAGWLDEKSGYYRISIKGKQYLLHRVIFKMHHGYDPVEVDHINGDKTDNRIENLRAATKEQNSHNRFAYKNNTSGHKNVSWSKGKWSVNVHFAGKKHHFGYFKDLELADLVAQEARDKFHGAFARHF